MNSEEFQILILEQLTTLNKGQADLNSKINTIDLRLDSLKTKVDKIDASQVRMENELTEKVRALFDAREAQNDVNERTVFTLERIEAKVDVLQMETAHLRRVK